jgi:hypothetical protein
MKKLLPSDSRITEKRDKNNKKSVLFPKEAGKSVAYMVYLV